MTDTNIKPSALFDDLLVPVSTATDDAKSVAAKSSSVDSALATSVPNLSSLASSASPAAPKGTHLSFLSNSLIQTPSAPFVTEAATIRGGNLLKISGDETISPVELGSGIAVVRIPSKICCGRVGAQAKFCASVAPCPVVSHRNDKCTSVVPGIYLVASTATANRKESLHLEPHVPLTNVSESVITAWLQDTTKSTQDWIKSFSLLNSMEDSVSAEIEDLIYNEEIQDHLQSSKTPKVSRLSRPDEKNLDSVDEGIEESYIKTEQDGEKIVLFKPSETFKNLVDQTWDNLTTDEKDELAKEVATELLLLINKVDAVHSDAKNFMAGTRKRDEAKEHIDRATLNRLSALETLLGDAGKCHLLEDSSPTVWGCIQSLFQKQQLVIDFFEDINTLKVSVQATRTGLQADLSKLDRDLTAQMNALKVTDGCTLPPWWSPVQASLRTTLTDHQEKLIALATYRSDSSKTVSALDQKVSAFVSKFDGLANGTSSSVPKATTGFLSSPVEPGFGAPSKLMSALSGGSSELDLAQIRQELAMLSQRFDDITSSKDQDAVKIGDSVFTGVPDVNAWIEEHLPARGEKTMPDFGLFVDPINLLYRGFIRGTMDAAALKDVKLRQDLGLSPNEAIALSACGTVLPPLFTKGLKSNDLSVGMGNEKTKLSGINKYADWYNSHHRSGIRGFMETNLPLISEDIRTGINLAFPSDKYSRANMTANNILTQSLLFLNRLFHFFSATYDDLKDAGNPEGDAFYLVTHLVYRIFTLEFGAARTGMATNVNTLNIRQTAATNLWGTLRTMDVVASYLKVEFEDHPSITAGYIKYTVQNSAAGKVPVLEKANRELEKEVKKLRKDLDSAISSISSLKSEFSQLKAATTTKLASLKSNKRSNASE